MTGKQHPQYVPALGYHWLTPFYDLIAQVTVRERTIKRALIRQADFQGGQKVLDIGCGTGTLALWSHQACPDLAVYGLDADRKMLAKATAKALGAQAEIAYQQGMSYQLPYLTGSFEQGFSSLFFHHLDRPQKEATSKEIFRVLQPGGRLLVLDWGKAANLLMRALFLPVQLVDGVASTKDNIAGRLPDIFSLAGFQKITIKETFSTLFGTVTLYSALKPGVEKIPPPS